MHFSNSEIIIFYRSAEEESKRLAASLWWCNPCSSAEWWVEMARKYSEEDA